MNRKFLLLLLLVSAVAGAQDDGDSNPQVVRPGPFGVPISVKDDGDHWSIPIQVYADDDAEAFVPDITSLGWRFWHSEEFKNGLYTVYLYSYYKNNHVCLQAKRIAEPGFVKADCSRLRYVRRYLEVNLRAHTVRVPQVTFMTEYAWPVNSIRGGTFSFNQLQGTPLGKEIEVISSIVESEMEQDGVEQSKELSSKSYDAGSNKSPSSGAANGTVSSPKVIYNPDPEYTDEARKAKLQGNCVLELVVGTDGLPQRIRVTKSLGDGLDEKAIEAVHLWRFEPALKDGKPVATQIKVEVFFRLH